MRYFVTIDGEELEVEIDASRGPGRAVVTHGGERHVVELLAPPAAAAGELTARTSPPGAGGAAPLQLHAALFGAIDTRSGAPLRLLAGGRPIEARIETERDRLRARSRPPAANGGRLTVHSALPGVIRRILRRAGEPVEGGAAILTLEAMKMENEVQAEAAGTVRAVLVREGQVVNAGEPLAELELRAGPPGR